MKAGTADAPTGAPQRRVDVELLRIVSIVGVILIHSTGSSIAAGATDGEGPSYWIALGLNSFSRFSVPLFFAIAGWAQLARRPADDEGQWLSRRLMRLIVPLLIWSAIYLMSEILRAALSGALPWASTDVLHWLNPKLQLTVLGPGVKGQLWFIYFLIPLTIVIWLVQVAPGIAAAGRAGQGLSGVVARGMAAYATVAIGLLVVLGLASVLRLPISWGGFVWTLGYAAIGFLVLSWRPPRRRWLALGLYAVAGATILVLGDRIGYNTWPFFNQSPPVLIATLGVLVAGATLDERSFSVDVNAWIRRVGALTFGAFLAHFLVLDWLRAGILALDSLVGVPGPIKLVALIGGTVVLTFALVGVWHRSRRLTTLLG